MVEPRHSFTLTASFDQRLSLVVAACICLTSFLAWPYFGNAYFQLFKYLLFSLICLFFIYQFYQLKQWSCQFTLGDRGEGMLSIKAPNRYIADSTQVAKKFKLIRKPVITSFIVLFYIQLEGSHRKRLMIVWADMLDDTGFRHLCRLLLNAR
ncbi:protein YgfX [Shewanella sp. UCD-KL12]|uniref:protein YgfX n=1 Tax=Shewanella sp. UCD-KL12 TaxID=1917163 RepID=UPI000971314B